MRSGMLESVNTIVALVVSFDNIKQFLNYWMVSDLILCIKQRLRRSHIFEGSRDHFEQAD